MKALSSWCLTHFLDNPPLMPHTYQSLEGKQLSGRNRRLLYEWQKLEQHLSARKDIDYLVAKANSQGLPISYQISYHIKSICGIEADFTPIFAKIFLMQIDIPDNYPCIDALPYFHFLTHDKNGCEIPHPWHPNIRYYGEFAGRVCLNMPDTYTDLAWGVERVAHYLRYDLYHAIVEPPYPEDLRVADWVTKHGEPNKWIFFDQESTSKENL